MVLKTTGLEDSEQDDDKDKATAVAAAVVGGKNTKEKTAATALPSGSQAATVNGNLDGNEMGTDRQTTHSAELEKELSRLGQQEITTGESSSSPLLRVDTCKPSISWPKRTQGSGNAQTTAQSSCSAEGSAANQVGTQTRVGQVNDSEIATVSESMAHASLTTPSSKEQQNVVVSEHTAATGVQATAAVIPKAASASTATSKPPKPNEGRPKKKKRSPPPVQPGQSSGRWTHTEHEAFLEGLKVFGREWKKVAVRIPTRTSAQVRSHAQKYFSKLARDEQLMNQEGQAYDAAAAAAAGSSASTASAGSSAAAEAMAAAQAHPPEVQRQVERILAHPEQAQRDVEDTLRALRERYEQLQQRLSEHQAFDRRQGSPAHRVEEEKEETNNDNNQQQQQASNNQSEQPNEQQRQQQRGGKRRRGGSGSGDESSLASSTLSSLGNEELIALSVLGATLPNGGGGTAPEASAAAAQPSAEASGNGSSNSSLESHSTTASSSSNPVKRKREDAA